MIKKIIVPPCLCCIQWAMMCEDSELTYWYIPEKVPIIDFPTAEPTKVEVTVPTGNHVARVLHLLNLVVTSRTLLCLLFDFHLNSLDLIRYLSCVLWQFIMYLLAGLSFMPRLSTGVTELPTTLISVANKVFLHNSRTD